MGVLFIFTFGDFFEAVSSEYKYAYTLPAGFKILIYSSIIAGGLLLLINGFSTGRAKQSRIEEVLLLIILAAVTLFTLHPLESFPYAYIFNPVFIITLLYCVIIGYQIENIGYIGFGIFWLTAYLIARYCDMFWELLPRSLFFAIGGILLLLWGITLEHRRKQLRQQFGRQS